MQRTCFSPLPDQYPISPPFVNNIPSFLWEITLPTFSGHSVLMKLTSTSLVELGT